MSESRGGEVIVAVVDDDASAREGLSSLIRSAGLRVETFASASEFLARPAGETPGCLVLDLQMPGLTGLELQKRMGEAGMLIPIVFLTGHGNIPASVQAIKGGAVEFLTKPFDEEELLRAIQEALERDRNARERNEDLRHLQELYESLTAREREVMRQVVAGRLNKQIAAELKITEYTVKIHRGHVMHKMRASSVADLVRMADALGIGPRGGAKPPGEAPHRPGT